MEGGESLSSGERHASLHGIAFVTKDVKNVAASVRQRLLNLARKRNDDFGLVLTKYALERMLYRISKSRYKAMLILKGALLFELWTEQRYRPTRDADFLRRATATRRVFRRYSENSAWLRLRMTD